MRHSIASSLPALLTGLVLTACGGIEGTDTPHDEAGAGALTEQSAALLGPVVGLSCSRTSGIYIGCTGEAAAGTAPYNPLWEATILYRNRTYPQGWFSGGFTQSFDCFEPLPGEERYWLSILFKVADANGAVSNTASAVGFECAL